MFGVIDVTQRRSMQYDEAEFHLQLRNTIKFVLAWPEVTCDSTSRVDGLNLELNLNLDQLNWLNLTVVDSIQGNLSR